MVLFACEFLCWRLFSVVGGVVLFAVWVFVLGVVPLGRCCGFRQVKFADWFSFVCFVKVWCGRLDFVIFCLC